MSGASHTHSPCARPMVPRSFNVKLKVLTPIHIGSGEEASPLDYFIDGNDFCRLNINTLLADAAFTPEKREKFIQVAGSQRYIGNQLPRTLLSRHVIYRIPVAGKAKGKLCAATESGKTVVKTFIKTAGQVFIPGSSLKGAILSALCWRILLDGWKTGRPDAQGDISVLLKRDQTMAHESLLGVVLPRLGGHGSRAFTHWLDVTDSNPISPADCLEISLASVQGAKGRGAIPVLYETLKPGAEFTFALKLDSASKLTPADLLTRVNEFHQRVAGLDEPHKKTPAPSGLIRLGQGSGAYSTSLLVLAEDAGVRDYRVRPPRTRKRVDDILPLGWAQLEVMK